MRIGFRRGARNRHCVGIVLILPMIHSEMPMRGERRWDGSGWNTQRERGVDPGIKPGTTHQPMKSGNGPLGPRAFGDAGDIAVQRGLTEFRAGRPVIIRAPDDAVVAMPIDGAGADRIAAFQALVHPARPLLAVTARRARALGLDAPQPVLVELEPGDDA